MCRVRDHGGRVCRKHAAYRKKKTLEANRGQIGLGDSVKKIDNAFSKQLLQFICKFSFSFATNRRNTSINFPFVIVFKPTLCLYPSFLINKVCSFLPENYPNGLRLQIMILFQHVASLGYKRPETHILSRNLSLAFLDPRKMNDKLNSDLVSRRISQVSPSPTFMYSLLELVAKGDSGF